jgi:2-polyprenyl-6-hydroxyphenyl methylase/3-demethylubiquinone-9 3-methyltransferase
MKHSEEIASGQRFEFGANWAHFLTVPDQERIAQAKASLMSMLGVESMKSLSFLDVGSGNGLFSLAARALGARAVSFDYHSQSVACTRELRRRFPPEDFEWIIHEGSVLDTNFLATLGCHDIVYSWGLLYDTGQMDKALNNRTPLVAPGGKLVIVNYNGQGGTSHRWTWAKKVYCPGLFGRIVMRTVFYSYFALGRLLADTLKRRNPFASYSAYKSARGTSVVHDREDWLGGYPLEVAQHNEIFDRFPQNVFILRKLRSCDGCLGCNEFVSSTPNHT